jgi:two-component system chemotaxis response regulator CheY
MVFLVAEDSRPTRNLIKNYVSEMDIGQPCSFIETENGEETLQLVQTRHIDFVLLDWNLSTKMTGLDVLKEIRKIEKHKDLPIIMVSSESDRFNVVESLKVGANAFVVKPIDRKVFEEKVVKNIRYW